ncbi:MAG: glycosyltransferase family 87 protein [Gemmataceae bacterium]
MIDAILRFAFHWLTRYVLAWLVALAALGLTGDSAWHHFNDSRRPSGNSAHTFIDFGGQWIMGRMVVDGHAWHLYDRAYQWSVAQAYYPISDEIPEDQRQKHETGHDANNLMGWLMGSDDPDQTKWRASFVTPLASSSPLDGMVLIVAGQRQWTPENLAELEKPCVGGPLYPPISAFVLAPQALLPPPQAYRVRQIVSLALALASALGIALLARGRVWWPVAVVFVLVYPGFGGNIKLGQNADLTLTILIWGWVLIARQHAGWGGIVWGLLAFKPVWAASFLLVLLLTCRWRAAAAMLSSSALLIGLTLPFVGLHSWWHWLEIGRKAALLYNVDENWVFLSRDLLGLPRRWLLDFEVSHTARDTWPAFYWSWGVYLAALALTVSVIWFKRRQAQATTGPVAAFILLGGWLSCYHFMYYDTLLTALPVALLFVEPRRYITPIFVVWHTLSPDRLPPDWVRYHQARLCDDYPIPPNDLPFDRPPSMWVLNRLIPTWLAVLLFVEHGLPSFEIALGFSMTADWLPSVRGVHVFATDDLLRHRGYRYPWDMFCLIFLWLWCGLLWLRGQTEIPPAPVEAIDCQEVDIGEGSTETTE